MGRGAESANDTKDVVLQHKLLNNLGSQGGVVGVILIVESYTPAVDPAVGVDPLEERLGRRSDLAIARSGWAGQWLMTSEQNACCRDAWSRSLIGGCCSA